VTRPSAAPLSDGDRAGRLDAAIDEEINSGGRPISLHPHHAVIAYGSGNIVLHITFAVLTLFTCGLFVFPWIVWANTTRERHVTLYVDPYGNVIRTAQAS
jgi:hypothetical protein